MPVSPYFNNFPNERRINNEHNLMEDVIVESIQIMGHNCYYIPRESLDNVDMIFGEETKVRFRHAYVIEAYIANVSGFEGDSDFFSKFGLEIRDTSNFVISRRSFSKIVPTALRIRPQEGDLIWVPLMHRMFEVKFIEKKLMFFSVGNRQPFVYEMRCEDFRYSQEDFDTKVGEIDAVEEENAYTVRVNIQTSGSGSFQDGEVVYQSPDGTWANNTAYATVREWYKANGTMFVYGVNGSFTPSENLIGNTSGAIFMTTSKDEISDFNNSVELVLDLSEINPFGTI